MTEPMTRLPTKSSRCFRSARRSLSMSSVGIFMPGLLTATRYFCSSAAGARSGTAALSGCRWPVGWLILSCRPASSIPLNCSAVTHICMSRNSTRASAPQAGIGVAGHGRPCVQPILLLGMEPKCSIQVPPPHSCTLMIGGPCDASKPSQDVTACSKSPLTICSETMPAAASVGGRLSSGLSC